jgi:pimeloyl-ACP methyl ester carboxylesterase
MAHVAVLAAVVFFNGMGSTRLQGLRYANHVETLEYGRTLYAGDEPGEKFFETVWPAEDFDDVYVWQLGRCSEKLTGEPERGNFLFAGLSLDSWSFSYTIVPHRWIFPCSERQIAKGIKDVRDALKVHEKVIIYGASRGASLALIVLSRLAPCEHARIHAVIAEAPFDSAGNVIVDRYHLPWWMGDLIDSVWPVSRPIDVELPKGVPILIGSGLNDTMCPSAGQARLKERNPHVELVVVEGAHHDNIWQDPYYRSRVKHFISYL